MGEKKEKKKEDDIDKGGRPCEFREEYIDRARKYLNNCEDTALGGNRIKVKLPSIEGFAFDLGFSKSTLYDWGKINKEFSNALKEIKFEQKERLMNSGLSGDYNPLITKLILSSNHGMKERTDQTSDDKPINKIGVEIRDFTEKPKNKKNEVSNKQDIQTTTNGKA